MSESTAPPDDAPDDAPEDAPDDEGHLGSLSVEDDPDGTVDPAELAGSAGDDDADSEADLRPTHSERDTADLED